MKKINLLGIAILLSVQSFAQQHLYTSTSQISNTIPFASTSSNFRQSVHYPTDFPNAPSGNITAIYILATAVVTPNITNMTVKMGNTTLATFPSGTYITGLQTVYSGPYNSATIAGNYIKINLQTPFAFDNTQKFILELSQTGYTTGFSIMQDNTNMVGRTIFGSINNTSGSLQDRLPKIGFDLDSGLSTLESSQKNKLVIYPNPVSDFITLQQVKDSATFNIYSSTGRLVSSGNIKNEKINVIELPKGTYILSVYEKDKEILHKKFTKK